MSNIQQKGDVLPYGKERKVSYVKVSHIPVEGRDLPPYKSDLLYKRFFDIIFSSLAILFVLSWLLPLLALLVKITSRGPVFFIQKRVGAYGTTFNCIKLRTMVVNAQANLRQAQENDPRITAVGRFLRLSCLDELPQFINVLKGEMSIIGPRPHMIRDCNEFSKVVKEYNSRTLVKPGITGMAQVKGYRGQTSDYFDIAHRYKWDMFYVRNLSFRLDMQILKLTVTSTLSAIYNAFFASGKQQQTEIVDYVFEAPKYLN